MDRIAELPPLPNPALCDVELAATGEYKFYTAPQMREYARDALALAAAPAPEGQAVAWRFWMDQPELSYNPDWSAWSVDPFFRKQCEEKGFRAEYATPQTEAQAGDACRCGKPSDETWWHGPYRCGQKSTQPPARGAVTDELCERVYGKDWRISTKTGRAMYREQLEAALAAAPAGAQPGEGR